MTNYGITIEWPLRANEAIQKTTKRGPDCFVAALLAMTRE